MSFTKEQMEEVWSWIHNERRCVTTQTISLKLGISRALASNLLSQLPCHKSGDYSYECIKCVESQRNGITVYKLVKSVVSGNDMNVDSEDTTVYSLALQDAESVHTAHEKDMAHFSDLLKQEDSPQATCTTMALDPTLHQCVVENSNFAKERMTAYASQQARLSGRVVAAAGAAMPVSTSTTKKAARKATTAANFFASSKSSSKTMTKKNAKKPPAASKKTTAPADKKKPPAEKKKAPSDKKKAPDDDDMDIDEPVQEEKENSVNKLAAIGNADDFVGDEDEDEEFLEAERERLRRNAAREKKKKKQEKQVPMEQDDDDDDEPVAKVSGAMDAFAKPQEKKPETTQRTKKRRKRLVEKTTVDDKGYMHTETEAVWEDVEEEEEVVAMPAVKKAPVKNTKNLKQGSLMGFFTKKK